MKHWLALTLSCCATAVLAETPQQLQSQYAAQARAEQHGYVPSAKRGAAFFRQPFAVNGDFPSCTSCHTDNPMNEGRHAVTGKQIKPLAVAANPARFSDPAHVEKWFGRNCRDVVGRQCSNAEKADFITYLMETAK